MAKGERHPSAEREKAVLERSEGGEEGRVVSGRVTSLLTKRERREGGREAERERETELLPRGINTERWSRVQ